MRKLIVFFLLLLVGCTNVDNTKESDNYEEIDNIVSDTKKTNEYFIDAVYNEEDTKLVVKQKIVYYSVADLNELYLNVYGNAITKDEPFVKVYSLKVDDREVNWEWSAVDRTNIYIPSIELETGEEVIIDIEYAFTLNEDGKRLGIKKLDYNQDNWDLIAMFFYPAVAMYDNAGWHIGEHSFDGNGYYNSISNYYVTLELPSKYVLATAGDIKSKQTKGNINMYEIELINGRDYSFSASVNYEEYNKNINGVEVRVLSLKNIDNEIDKVFKITEEAIDFAEDIIGPYIYDTLTIEFGHLYGMESSTIVYCDVDKINYNTVVHEIYHQWFYNIIGNNQRDEYWLDEGVTTFFTGEFIINNQHLIPYDYYGAYDMNQEKYASYHEQYGGNSVLRSIDEFTDDLGLLAYWYGTTILHYYVENLLEGDEELMYKALGKYYDEYYLEVASIDEFLNLLEEETGVENTKDWFMKYLSEFQYIE